MRYSCLLPTSFAAVSKYQTHSAYYLTALREPTFVGTNSTPSTFLLNPVLSWSASLIGLLIFMAFFLSALFLLTAASQLQLAFLSLSSLMSLQLQERLKS